MYGEQTYWVESYEDGTRKNSASIGFTYDSERDAFIPPKPYDSWILIEENCRWEAPAPHPMDGKQYVWDEESLEWKEV